MNTFLTFLPLIIVTVVLGFGCLLVLDDARRRWKESDSAITNHHKAHKAKG